MPRSDYYGGLIEALDSYAGSPGGQNIEQVRNSRIAETACEVNIKLLVTKKTRSIRVGDIPSDTTRLNCALQILMEQFELTTGLILGFTVLIPTRFIRTVLSMN